MVTSWQAWVSVLHVMTTRASEWWHATWKNIPCVFTVSQSLAWLVVPSHGQSVYFHICILIYIYIHILYLPLAHSVNHIRSSSVFWCYLLLSPDNIHPFPINQEGLGLFCNNKIQDSRFKDHQQQSLMTHCLLHAAQSKQQLCDILFCVLQPIFINAPFLSNQLLF